MENPQQPSADMVARVRRNAAAPIVVDSKLNGTKPGAEAAENWALSAERAPVFTLTEDNPAYDAQAALDAEAAGATYDVPAEIQTEYTMPAKPNAGLALTYLRKARTEGGDFAMSWLIELAIGADGYDALAAQMSQMEPDAAMELMQTVAARINRVAMGGLEGKV